MKIGHLGQQINWIPYYATVMTEKSATLMPVDHNQPYRALPESTLPDLSGTGDMALASMDELIEPKLAAIATRRSWLRSDVVVHLDELHETDGGFDGAKFAVEYR